MAQFTHIYTEETPTPELQTILKMNDKIVIKRPNGITNEEYKELQKGLIVEGFFYDDNNNPICVLSFPHPEHPEHPGELAYEVPLRLLESLVKKINGAKIKEAKSGGSRRHKKTQKRGRKRTT